jgi:hypothetical protein
MDNKFKVGDVVMISTSSEYYTVGTTTNPKDIKGRVISVQKDYGDLPYLVKWDNDTTNGYEASDLIKVEEVKEKEKTIHDILVERSTLEVGDIVIVTHKVPSRDLGWHNSWCSDMDRAIGKECVVTSAPGSDGILLGGLGGGFNYPLQSVRFLRKASKKIHLKISEDYNATVSEDNIKVGCQTITFTAFDELVAAVAKMRK